MRAPTIEELRRQLADVNMRIDMYDEPEKHEKALSATGKLEVLLYYRKWYEAMIEKGT